MELSFWERQQWFTQVDFTIVGSGIVGLNAALKIKEERPKAKVLVLDQGAIPQGASTKNAGFACFGSLSEILDDLMHQSEASVVELIQKRFLGLKLLREQLGDKAIDFKSYGGYELFFEKDADLYERTLNQLSSVNELLRPYFETDVFKLQNDSFGFKGILPKIIYNPFEGQIDSGKMMQALLQKARKVGIEILNGLPCHGFEDLGNQVIVKTDGFEFYTQHLLFATNGFAEKLTQGIVRPARAQVLVTTEIPNLHIKGTFHIDRGYYYFRNIGNRILFGGARHLDFETETTTEFGPNPLLLSHLETVLKTVILPDLSFDIEMRWSGIMGLGPDKNPSVSALSPNVFYGVRLGGMGVAIGTKIGFELAELAL